MHHRRVLGGFGTGWSSGLVRSFRHMEGFIVYANSYITYPHSYSNSWTVGGEFSGDLNGRPGRLHIGIVDGSGVRFRDPYGLKIADLFK